MVPWPRLAKRAGCTKRAVKYAVYEDPVTHRFALIWLPDKFFEGDKVQVRPSDRWFESREEAVAALPELLNQET
jgi:hypothetical protein